MQSSSSRGLALTLWLIGFLTIVAAVGSCAVELVAAYNETNPDLRGMQGLFAGALFVGLVIASLPWFALARLLQYGETLERRLDLIARVRSFTPTTSPELPEDSPTARLQALARLHDEGALTSAEFFAAKRSIIGDRVTRERAAREDGPVPGALPLELGDPPTNSGERTQD